MRFRIVLISALAVMATLALSVFADIVWHTPEERSQNMLQAFTKALDLSLDQQSQLKPMLWDHINAQDVLRQEYMRKARAEDEATDQKILAALTEAQKAKYPTAKQDVQEQLQESQHPSHAQGGGGGGHHGGGSHF